MPAAVGGVVGRRELGRVNLARGSAAAARSPEGSAPRLWDRVGAIRPNVGARDLGVGAIRPNVGARDLERRGPDVSRRGS